MSQQGPPNTTYVSFLIHSPTDIIEPTQRIEWLNSLLNLQIEFILCVDSFYFKLVPWPLQNPNARVFLISPNDFETYRQIHRVSQPILPRLRNEKKDTLEYLSIQNLKPELLYRVLKTLRIYTPYIAYIDAGIAKIFKDPLTIRRLETLSFRNIPFLLLPGCHPMPSTPPALEVLADRINWTFCGGFFVVPTDKVESFYNRHAEAVRQFLERGFLTWEVNVWTSYLPLTPGTVWFSADHNNTMLTNIPSAQQQQQQQQ